MGFLRFADITDFEQDDEKSISGFRLVDFTLSEGHVESNENDKEDDDDESECSCEICCTTDP